MFSESADGRTVEAAFDQARDELYAEFGETAQPIAYHYGPTSAVRAIVETGKVWATDVAFLNDPIEWKHGHALVAAEIKRAGTDPRAVDEGVLQRLDQIADHVLQRAERKFFLMCASLCTNSDDLALWRPYGADGDGCSVGIDLAKIAHDQSLHSPAVGRIIYEEREKAERVKKAVAKHVSTCLDLKKHGSPSKDVFIELSRSLQVIAGQLAMTMKHHAYSSEREWRLLRFFNEHDPDNSNSVRYRITAAGHLAPYVEIDVRTALVEVVLGPRQPIEAGECLARMAANSEPRPRRQTRGSTISLTASEASTGTTRQISNEEIVSSVQPQHPKSCQNRFYLTPSR